MDKEEYDRRFRSQPVSPEPLSEDLSSVIDVDSTTIAPLRITLQGNSPQAVHERHMQQLEEKIRVVGRTERGTELIRREGGSDYAGNEAWRRLMRRVGRLR